MMRTPKEYREMGLSQDEAKDLYDGAASRLADNVGLMSKYDEFVNRPHTLGDYYEFCRRMETIKKEVEENREEIVDRMSENREHLVPVHLRAKGYTYEDWVDLRMEYNKPEYHDDMPDRDDREEEQDDDED